MPEKLVAIIGGSGFYEFISTSVALEVDTPFSEGKPVKIWKGMMSGREVVFLPRHGFDHSISPHQINYKANLYALYKIGVTQIIAESVVGSLRDDIKPGSLVIPDQFIDPMLAPITFFEDEFSVTTSHGQELSGVVHTDMTDPFCPSIRETIKSVLDNIPNVFDQGTYFYSRGPRFETRAEIRMLKSAGADIVGMSVVPEMILARELGICYGCLCVVTNYGAGIQAHVTYEEVIDKLHEKLMDVKEAIAMVVAKLPKDHNCLAYQEKAEG